MDTNLQSILIQALAGKQGDGPDSVTMFLVVGMIITATAPTLAAFAAYISAKAAKATAAETAATAAETAATAREIHVAVNSERTAMMKKLEDLTAEILRISKSNATLEETQRGDAKAKAIVDAKNLSM